MQNQYLVPANSNKSRLFLGIFEPRDIVVAVIGILITVLLLIIFNHYDGLIIKLICVVPFGIAAFLCVPVPNYHNMLTFILNIFHFLFERKTYYWKGWCVRDEFEEWK